MNNRDYNNKSKELQIYQGSLDNYEESGNTQNDNINDSNSHNNLSSNYEIGQDGLGNISEDGYTETYYSKKRNETRGKHKEKDYMPDFLLGAFIFLLFGLSSGIYSLPKFFSKKEPPPPPSHPFMSLSEISMPLLDGDFESKLQTADLKAVKHAISISRKRLDFLYNKTSGWEEKIDKAIKKNDSDSYTTYKLGLDFNLHQIEKLNKQLEMLEKKKQKLEALKK